MHKATNPIEMTLAAWWNRDYSIFRGNTNPFNSGNGPSTVEISKHMDCFSLSWLSRMRRLCKVMVANGPKLQPVNVTLSVNAELLNGKTLREWAVLTSLQLINCMTSSQRTCPPPVFYLSRYPVLPLLSTYMMPLGLGVYLSWDL